MKALALLDIVQVIGGVLLKGDGRFPIRKVVVKSEELQDHRLLFSIGRNNNLTTPTGQVYQSCAIVTDNPAGLGQIDANITVVKVSDVKEAYWKFVRYYRSLFQLTVIGVTGTCGKTTTKEMITHILAKHQNVVSTYLSHNGSVNNLMYLLKIDEKTDSAVIEMGVAHPDDLIDYGKYFQPDIGVITTIGTDHLDRCKTMENYILEKAKMLQIVNENGNVILNVDNEHIRNINTSGFKGTITYFGVNDKADFQAKNIRYAPDGMRFTLRHHAQNYESYVPGYGEHNVYNALAAIAACHAAGVDVKEAAERLATFRHVEKHLQIRPAINGATLIDDTWSSNPTSAELALKVLKELAKGRKTIAVLGKMELLGTFESELHARIGEKVVEYGIDVLLTTDKTAKKAGLRALEMGMDPSAVHFCNDPEEVYQVVKNMLDDQTLILVKMSMLHRRSSAFVENFITE